METLAVGASLRRPQAVIQVAKAENETETKAAPGKYSFRVVKHYNPCDLDYNRSIVTHA